MYFFSIQTGPIRPFTPYQRKRKNQQPSDQNKVKLERLTSKDSTTDESPEVGTPGTPLAGVNTLNPLAFLKMNQAVSTDDLWKNLEEVISPITTTTECPPSPISNLNSSSDFGKVCLACRVHSPVVACAHQKMSFVKIILIRSFFFVSLLNRWWRN